MAFQSGNLSRFEYYSRFVATDVAVIVVALIVNGVALGHGEQLLLLLLCL